MITAPATVRECEIDGCADPVSAKAKCRKHYRAAHYEANRERITARNAQNRATNGDQWNATVRAKRAADPETFRAKDRARYLANPEKWRRATLKRYGITVQRYDELLTEQGGGCAVCGVTEQGNGRLLAVDHDHDTGAVRGLLCGPCNAGVGMFQDSPALLAAAITYLRTRGYE